MTTNTHADLMERHQAMQAQLANQPDALTTDTILQFLEEARAAGATIGDVRQREQLRAILRHWGGIIFDRQGDYPATQLAPFEGKPPSPLPAEDQPVNPSSSQWRLIVIGVGVVVGLFLLVAMASFFGVNVNGLLPMSIDVTEQISVAITTVGVVVTEAASGSDGITPTLAPSITSTPTETPTPQTAVAHSVRSGETLEGIARQYGVTVNQIMALNQLAADSISVGQQLFVPLNTQFIVLELVVKSAVADLHNVPELGSRSLAKLERGTFATISGQTADLAWYQVTVEDSRNMQGWLSAADVRLLYPTRPEIIPLVTPTP